MIDFFFFSSRRRHTSWPRDWSSDVCSSDLTLLREYGVNVIEHEDDYSKAVEAGRDEAMKRDDFYFVDDEDSETLFLGYAVSALRLKNQLTEAGIEVDADNPLYVYLP